jgi:4-hydroxyproline epimerase
MIEHGLVSPRSPGIVKLDTPAGLVTAEYRQQGAHVEEVRLTNVAAFVHSRGLVAHVEGLGEVTVDVAYGGNFYAIIEPQPAFADLGDVSVGELLAWSPRLRTALNAAYEFHHPERPEICGLSHILWTGKPTQAGATARNAVFYGDNAIDRSPCGTGTSARMAHWAAAGRLKVGEDFVHESIIGSLFRGRIEAQTRVGDYPAIIPSVAGWARVTGLNSIFVDDRDPFAHGFSLPH